MAGVIGDWLVGRIREAWMTSGHNMTGAMSESLEWREPEPNVIEVWGNLYGNVLDKGIKPERIPYKRGSGAGTSKYITGLINWVSMRLGITGSAGKSIAFAIAEKHKREGLQASEWLSSQEDEIEIELDRKIQDYVDEKFLENKI
jgi:hypothetical protein